MSTLKLTDFSSGSGCGCKIAPAVLDQVLAGLGKRSFPNLLVGPEHRDDAAVYRLGADQLLIATTDFFTPIVNDPYDFGRIAATNAISDVYAMGGRPIMALSVLAWPTNKLAPEIAAEVLRGAQEVCDDAGIPLAGGHSIDGPEPVFGLCVNGLATEAQLRTNGGGKPGDLLYLTKPLGVGILASALKKDKISTPDLYRLLDITTQLNSIGALFGDLPMVHALTDVTGFGLLGHLLEMCAASATGAELELAKIPLIPGLQVYLDQFLLPDQVYRNWNAYGAQVQGVTGPEFMYLCDPQTSGGLLVSIDQHAAYSFEQRMQAAGQAVWQIGRLTASSGIQICQ